MIIYQSSALEFRNSVDNNQIVFDIEKQFIEKYGKHVSDSEKSSWNNSLKFMETIVRNSKVADDCGVLIEYGIPASSKRIDFVISGCDQQDEANFVIIELKQWSKAQATDKLNVVQSYVGSNVRDLTHPSYQAWSYKQHIMDMNEAVYSQNIIGHSCAYLHNYQESKPEPLTQSQYQEIIKESPIYFRQDHLKLQDFLYKFVGKGKGLEILYRIENGKIKPSKKLIDYVSSMFAGNKEFIMLDEQLVAYSNIIYAAKEAKCRTTIIVKGGPGTGKSVISMNAFGELLKNEKNIKFVAPNASFRTVILESLVKNKKQGRQRMSGLFAGSSSFYNTPEKTFDVIIVDEAHRLKGKGAYMYQGINQIEDIIHASNINVFFIDDNQRIRPDDIGCVNEIKKIADRYKSKVIEFELEAQFRCAGAEGFMNWVDHTLQIRDTANYDGWDKGTFDFAIMDTPNAVYEKIKEKTKNGKNARMLAGFAWKWTADKEGNNNGQIDDVVIEKHQFRMPWNARSNSTTWAIQEGGIEQIGCIHTSQGLEFDYVGVIIGDDLKFNSSKMELYSSYDNYFDAMGKRGLKDNPVELIKLIKNIYKVLLSRGMKGCYIYCCDKELDGYIRGRLSKMENYL